LYVAIITPKVSGIYYCEVVPVNIETIQHFQNIDFRTIVAENSYTIKTLSQDFMMATFQDEITKLANKLEIRLDQHINHTKGRPLRVIIQTCFV